MYSRADDLAELLAEGQTVIVYSSQFLNEIVIKGLRARM
jgi:hypothetical protein